MADKAIDYAALAKQAGAVATGASPPIGDVGPERPTAAAVDYAALAKQAGAVSSASPIGDVGPEQPAAAGTWEDRGIGGKVWHPADGGKERNRADNSLFGMPPEFAALSGLAIARAVGAPALTAAARAVAGIKAVAGQALPQVKYEVTKTALEAAGVPKVLSIPVAIMVSGYKKVGKAEPAVSDVSPPGVDRYMPNVSGAPPTPPRPPAPAAIAPTEFEAARAARQTTNTLPDQRALNDAALKVRRDAFAARQTPPPPPAGPIVKASGQMKLTGPEFSKFQTLVKDGTSYDDAYAQLMVDRFPGSMTDAQRVAETAARVGNKSPSR